MKTLITLLTISISTLCYSQWSGIYFHGDQESAITVLNEDTIVAVTNGGGRIHRSTDGGETWSFYQTVFSEEFLDIDFPTNSVGYASGGSAFGIHKEFIAKTIDGGQTWDSLVSNDGGYYFTKIRFINADTGFVAPMSGELQKTTNGGATFTQIPLIDPKMLGVKEIAIKANEEIFVALKLTEGPGITSYSICRSDDLGVNWTTVYTGDENVSNIFFVDDNIGYAVGGDGLFLKTIDGGSTWTKTLISPYTSLTGLYFISPEVGYINNAGGIYRTEDGGINWTVQNISPLTIIHQIKFANNTIGYALGDNGIYKTTNGGLLMNENEIDNNSDFTIYPNPTNDKIFITPFNEPMVSVAIFNQLGQKIIEFEAKNELDVSFLSKGVYLLVIKTDKYQTTKRFVKE